MSTIVLPVADFVLIMCVAAVLYIGLGLYFRKHYRLMRQVEESNKDLIKSNDVLRSSNSNLMYKLNEESAYRDRVLSCLRSNTPPEETLDCIRKVYGDGGENGT